MCNIAKASVIVNRSMIIVTRQYLFMHI